jgi:molybdopterin-containing oxidoreductase family membrane subunit
MQERHALSPPRINADLLGFVLKTPRWFWIAAGVFGAILGAAVVSETVMVIVGLQVMGLSNTQLWAVLITNFIFWVGISHAGVMISSILRLTQAEWRRPITRSAEVLAIFSLATAGVFPLIHTGRIWRTLYWIFPYDFTRNIWPNVRSALVWDPSAIVTYLTGTLLFVYVDLIPDLAVARDRSHGWRHLLYTVLALGFTGRLRQWRVQEASGMLLSALILCVFVSVHSIVAWDLSMAILPGWHSTALAPYFVIGAVHSGVAGVVTTMIALRYALKARDYITDQHLDTIARLQIVVALAYLFFFLTDFYFGLFARDPVEVRVWELRTSVWPNNLLFLIQVVTALVIPFPLWLFRRIRRSAAAMFWISISVNIGMFLERYLLVVNPVTAKQPFVFMWLTAYQPRLVEYLYTAGAVALVAVGILVFAKLLPIIPLWDVKEGQVLAQEVLVGRARVPAVVRESAAAQAEEEAAA